MDLNNPGSDDDQNDGKVFVDAQAIHDRMDTIQASIAQGQTNIESLTALIREMAALQAQIRSSNNSSASSSATKPFCPITNPDPKVEKLLVSFANAPPFNQYSLTLVDADLLAKQIEEIKRVFLTRSPSTDKRYLLRLLLQLVNPSSRALSRLLLEFFQVQDGQPVVQDIDSALDTLFSKAGTTERKTLANKRLLQLRQLCRPQATPRPRRTS